MIHFRQAAIAAIALSAVVGCSGTSDKVKGGDPRSSVVSAPSSTVRTTTTRADTHSDIEIVGKGFSEAPPDSIGSVYTSYGVLVRNPNLGDWLARDISLNLSFYDASGTVVKSESENIAIISPSQTAAVGNSSDFKGTTRFEVQALVGRWEKLDAGVRPGSFRAENVNTRPQDFGGLTTTAVLVSTFSGDMKSVQVVALYYNSAGSIVGGAWTFADFVPAGGRATVEIRGSADIGGVTATQVYGVLTNLSLAGI